MADKTPQAGVHWLYEGTGMQATFTIPVKTVSVANKREHWATRARRTRIHRLSAYMAARDAGAYVDPGGKVAVLMIRMGGRVMDDDNLKSALKAVRDGIADALGIDDGDPRITWNYEQAKGSGDASKGSVIVRISEIA